MCQKYNVTLLFIIVLWLMQCVCPTWSQIKLVSPCPELLHIDETTFGVGVWGGTLQLQLEPGTIGLFVQIKLDSKINVITNNVSLITTKDNQLFLIENFPYEPPMDAEPFFIGFTVKFNGAFTTPQVERIVVNGRLECPTQTKQKEDIKMTTTTGKPQKERTVIPFINIFDDDEND